jgi:plasmid stabilization system protein ParE
VTEYRLVAEPRADLDLAATFDWYEKEQAGLGQEFLDELRATYDRVADGPLAYQDLAYLGRYTHRVAISNERLVAVTDGRVRFRWRDYADGNHVKVMDLDADELLRRFLLHVVPDGFVRIRHFGLLANRRRAEALAQCRTLLAQPAPPPVPSESARALMLRLTGIDIERCPSCQQGVLRQLEVLRPAPLVWDTS